MKNVFKSFIGFLLALAASSAVAQNAIQVKVPFAFSAAQQALPAGDYRVTLDRAVDRITIRGEGSGAILFVTLQLTLTTDEASFVSNVSAMIGSSRQPLSLEARRNYPLRKWRRDSWPRGTLQIARPWLRFQRSHSINGV